MVGEAVRLNGGLRRNKFQGEMLLGFVIIQVLALHFRLNVAEVIVVVLNEHGNSGLITFLDTVDQAVFPDGFRAYL